MTTRPPRILISAGETSGDRLGAGLALALRTRCPGIEILGMGGPKMAEAGVRLVQDSAEVAVVGFSEVVAHLAVLRRAMSRLEGCLERDAPDLLVPIDFPDFNLRLARRARSRRVAVVYFVSPQIWAWRRGRVRSIRRVVRRMLVLFPFEVGLYEGAGVPVSFVGHPAAEQERPDRARAESRERAGLDPACPVVGLLPGSRRAELSRHLRPMLDAVGVLRRARPSLQALLPIASGLSREWVAEQVAVSGTTAVRLHEGALTDAFAAMDVCAVASGTASLEAAVAEVPMVVVYRMSPLSYLIGRMLVRLEHVALPNLVAGRGIVPELIQGACTGERIAASLARYLESPEVLERARGELTQIRRKLGGPGVFERAAEQVLAELDRSRA